MFRKLIVAVAENPLKRPFFKIEERLAMVREAIKSYPDVDVVSFDCLLIDFVKKYNAQVIVRGLRAVSDFEYELQMALVNRQQDGNIETVFMMPNESYCYLSSKLMKEAAAMGADLSRFVPEYVANALKRKLKK